MAALWAGEARGRRQGGEGGGGSRRLKQSRLGARAGLPYRGSVRGGVGSAGGGGVGGRGGAGSGATVPAMFRPMRRPEVLQVSSDSGSDGGGGGEGGAVGAAPGSGAGERVRSGHTVGRGQRATPASYRSNAGQTDVLELEDGDNGSDDGNEEEEEEEDLLYGGLRRGGSYGVYGTGRRLPYDDGADLADFIDDDLRLSTSEDDDEEAREHHVALARDFDARALPGVSIRMMMSILCVLSARALCHLNNVHCALLLDKDADEEFARGERVCAVRDCLICRMKRDLPLIRFEVAPGELTTSSARPACPCLTN